MDSLKSESESSSTRGLIDVIYGSCGPGGVVDW